MVSSLPRGAPEDQQVDPAAILRFLDAVEDHPGVEMHSLMVVRHGHVVAEGWWAPYSAERPHLLYSLSKSFTATAAAFAQAEGLLDLDDTVVSHFGEFAADITDAQITLIEPANSLTFGVGAGEWTVSAPADGHGDTIPVAASGGWLDDRTFRAEVIFLETPHRMDITCSPAGRRAEAVWRHPPLSRNRLQDLHCPG